MLDAGTDPDAYFYEKRFGTESGMLRSRTLLQAAAERGDYDLVCLLLERGVDLTRPALGYKGMTALQAICFWDPARPEERVRKDKILRLLLDKGAEANAASSGMQGAALRAAAMHGDFSTAFLPLKHGAEINAVSGDDIFHYPGTALDAAAEHGRLDTVFDIVCSRI